MSQLIWEKKCTAIIPFGTGGAGKGTVIKELLKRRFPSTSAYLSTGDIVRADPAMSAWVREHGQALVPDHMLIPGALHQLEHLIASSKSIIALDGLPRRLEQVSPVVDMIEGADGLVVPFMIKISGSTLLKRHQEEPRPDREDSPAVILRRYREFFRETTFAMSHLWGRLLRGANATFYERRGEFPVIEIPRLDQSLDVTIRRCEQILATWGVVEEKTIFPIQVVTPTATTTLSGQGDPAGLSVVRHACPGSSSTTVRHLL